MNLRTVRVYQLTIQDGSIFSDEDNIIDCLELFGTTASFLQLSSVSGGDLAVRLNGSEDFTLFDETQNTFDNFVISSVAFQNAVSGGNDRVVEVILGVDKSLGAEER